MHFRTLNKNTPIKPGLRFSKCESNVFYLVPFQHEQWTHAFNIKLYLNSVVDEYFCAIYIISLIKLSSFYITKVFVKDYSLQGLNHVEIVKKYSPLIVVLVLL